MSKDLITKEIEENKKYISENALVKFYKKSKYLSDVWKIYRTRFTDFENIVSTVTSNTTEEIEAELITRPFKFILTELRINFNRYFTKREIIYTKKKINIAGKDMIMMDRKFGKETNHYNLLETEAKEMVDEFFLLSNGFLIPFLKVFREKNLISNEQLTQMEEKLNVRRFYDYKFMRRVKEIEKTESLKQIDAILKANQELKRFNEVDLLEYGKPTAYLLHIRDSYKAQKKSL